MKYDQFFVRGVEEQRPSDVVSILNQTPAVGSCFSEDDCSKLDELVRGNSSKLKELTTEQLSDLGASLDGIAYRLNRAEAWSKNLTPIQQQKKAEDIVKACGALLELLSADIASDPDLYDLSLVERHGIFETNTLHIGKLVAAIQIIARQSNHTIETIELGMRSDDPYFDRGRQLDRRNLWLYGQLAKLYRTYWGSGAVPVSRSNGVGGPSIRYFQFTIKKITGRAPSMDAVHDHLRKYVERGDPSHIVF